MSARFPHQPCSHQVHSEPSPLSHVPSVELWETHPATLKNKNLSVRETSPRTAVSKLRLESVDLGHVPTFQLSHCGWEQPWRVDKGSCVCDLYLSKLPLALELWPEDHALLICDFGRFSTNQLLTGRKDPSSYWNFASHEGKKQPTSPGGSRQLVSSCSMIRGLRAASFHTQDSHSHFLLGDFVNEGKKKKQGKFSLLFASNYPFNIEWSYLTKFGELIHMLAKFVAG